MDISGCSFYRLNAESTIKPFVCSDSTLQNFLLNSAKHYTKESLSATYILENDFQTLAYCSISNDSLNVQDKDFISVSAFKRFLKSIVSHPKRHLDSYPAIKIGRLAVHQDFINLGLGKKLVHFIIAFALECNEKCACKILTVDAYSESISFYEKIGFEFLTEKDDGEKTRMMFLRLSDFKDIL